MKVIIPCIFHLKNFLNKIEAVAKGEISLVFTTFLIVAKRIFNCQSFNFKLIT